MVFLFTGKQIPAGNVTLTYQENGLSSDETYWYRIAGFNKAGVKTAYITNSISLPPSQPTNFSGTGTATNSIQWSWVDASSTEDGFQLQDTNKNVLLSVSSNIQTVTESNLQPNTLYTRHITVTNDIADIDSSNASAWTHALPPENLIASNIQENGILLAWDTNNGGNAYFIIERAPDSAGTPGAFSIRESSNLTLTYQDLGLNSGTKYWYRVAGYNGGGIKTAYITNTFTTSNVGGANSEPSVQFVSSDGERGDVQLVFTVSDQDNDPVNLSIQYKSDELDISYTSITTLSALTNLSTNGTHTVVWDSAADIVGRSAYDITLKIIPDDGALSGQPILAENITLNNSDVVQGKVQPVSSIISLTENTSVDFSLNLLSGEDVTVMFYDITGNVRYTAQSSMTAGFNFYKINVDDISHLPSGVYLVEITGAVLGTVRLKLKLYR
jgi:hypothetical protein